MPVNPTDVKIEESWKERLSDEFGKDYFAQIKEFIVAEKQAGKTLYPPGSLIFNAFDLTPFDNVRVVILGQDPYHNPGEAMGLSFSVPKGVRVPPSLRRIYKEIKNDYESFEIPAHGDLTAWAKQGVLLLNAMLTVEHKKPGSHQKIGWQNFTDAVIKTLSEEREGLVFLLWGGFAKKKKSLIDTNKHHVLESAHPSPFTRDAWFNNGHFAKANELLCNQGLEEIDWGKL